jgi:hypothetical protein
MDFDAIPPEINSARMYSGPGAGPLVAAAAAWGRLATELNSTASAYSSVISGLTNDEWQGPSSALMAGAAAPYTAWLRATAAQAEQSAAQAQAAAGAYETALAMTVPPGVVAANRSQLMSLIVTNTFGQNTAAIAGTEADYADMWAQDAIAMNGYSTSSAAASALTPFTAPLHSANPAATVPEGLRRGVINTVFFLGRKDVDAITVRWLGFLLSSGVYSNFFLAMTNYLAAPAISVAEKAAVSAAGATAATVSDSQPVAEPLGGDVPARLVSTAPMRGSGAVSASSGRAARINGLAVPATWSAPVSVRRIAAAMPLASAGAPPIVVHGAGSHSTTSIAAASLMASSMSGLIARGGPAAPATSAAANTAAAVPPNPEATPAEGEPTRGAQILAAKLAAIPGAAVFKVPRQTAR